MLPRLMDALGREMASGQPRMHERKPNAMAGEQLDLTSNPPRAYDAPVSASRRPFVGIQFLCCEIYGRIYRNREVTAYEGRCPRCGKPVEIRIGPGGGSGRFFTAG